MFQLNNLPKGVKWLLITNVVVFLFQMISFGWIETRLGLNPYFFWSEFKIWQIITYMFLHGSFFHILMNMLTLWMFGKELEYSWGTKEFLKYYFLCGIGGGLLNVLVSPFSVLPIIGASGAIYGILVAYAILYPESIIYLYGLIPMQSRYFVLLLGVLEFFASFQGSSSPIARFAHLGGMLTGYLYLKSYEFRSFSVHLLNRFLDTIVIRKKTAPENFKKIQLADLDQEVDRILQKVLVQGVESLTEEEVRIMKIYSSRKN